MKKFTHMSRNERKYCFRVLDVLQGFYTFSYTLFDIILFVLVEFH